MPTLELRREMNQQKSISHLVREDISLESALLNEKVGSEKRQCARMDLPAALLLLEKILQGFLALCRSSCRRKAANEGMMQPRSRKSILHSRSESKNIAMDLSAISKIPAVTVSIIV